jgi:NADPH:quinone reductase-like Zn-dependent oxidoreductase
MYEAGTLRPHIMATYALEDYRRALQTVRDRKVVGKVVLLMER